MIGGRRLGTQEDSQTEYRAPAGNPHKSVLIIAKGVANLRDLPDCHRCRKRRRCMRQVLALQDFARLECNQKLARRPKQDTGQLYLPGMEEM